jgi:hypothetical protein
MEVSDQARPAHRLLKATVKLPHTRARRNFREKVFADDLFAPPTSDLLFARVVVDDLTPLVNDDDAVGQKVERGEVYLRRLWRDGKSDLFHDRRA